MTGGPGAALSPIRSRAEPWLGIQRGWGRNIFVLDSNLTDYIIVLGMFVIQHNRELLVEKMGF